MISSTRPNQIVKEYTVPSPASLTFQAYTTLAASGRGVTWYQYYSDGYPFPKTNTT
jgi:hypothetical protein